MLQVINWMEKLAALRRKFLKEGLLCGSTAGHFASSQGEESELDDNESASNDKDGGSGVEEKQGVEGRLGDVGPENRPPSLLSIVLAATPGIQKLNVHVY